ncbi:hypothetical protein [Sinorhizobium meliloti]|uniref:hypothetical protein n=1 Tax=Rhizobium meliloti TaxID=382 RepID=UPI0019149B72|nr:hypothetical protein [Sinorhizobium meliloti]
MSLFTKTANDVFAPYDSAGSPREVVNQEAQVWGTEVERVINAFTSDGGLIYTSKASLDADLAHGDHASAWVIGDPVAVNNGVYMKVGGSGAGSWTRVADLPFSFIVASDTGAGTPNAIQATTSIPVSGSALVWMNVFEANTASPVTVAFNGGAALTIKTNSGNDVAVGGLTAGMIVMGIVSGSTFRLVSDQASAAIIAQAEAYANAAAAAANAGFVFDTEADFESANIPLVLQFVETAGYYAPGDGGGHMKVRIGAPSPVEPWQKQSADGAWWEVSGDVSAVAFGARPNMSLFDSAPAITAALRYSAAKGYLIREAACSLYQGSPITAPNKARCIGANYETYIVKMPTYAGPAFRTEYFEFLTGTTNAFAPEVPETFQFDYFTFVGNYQNSDRTAYVQTAGQGAQIFSRKVRFKSRIFNMQGVGAWIECPGGNGPTPLQPGFSREADIELYAHQTQYEGVIWKGPPDVKCSWILQADAGSRIVADELNGKVSSPTYGAVNGGKCDGIVFDGIGAEVGEIHAFGNYGGGGIDWRGGRINAGLLMAESCHFGGISVSGSASGMISKLDVHRTGGFGGDTTADFIYAGTGSNNYGVEIGLCSVYRGSSAHTGARNGLEITGDFLDIGVAKVDLGSTATAGHGIFVDNDSAQWITIRGGEVARCKGTAPDGLASSAVYRKTTGNGSNVRIEVNVRDCDVAFRSAGTPRLEDIDIQAFLNTGQTLFAGDVRTNNGQRWDIRGTINGAWKGSKVDLAFTFDSTLTTEQTVTLPHNLIAAPSFGRITATLVDDGSALSGANTPIFFVGDRDATNITVKYKQAVATGANTTPRVWLHAEV